jgi:multidrug efflux pump subunit AcrA (membrane-fusion protein)
VYEKDLPKVASGQTIHFTLTNNPGKEYDAIIYSIGTAFANESKSIPVHARVINNKAGLIEGMSVTARISLGEKVYPAIPNDAIISNGGKDYIFILDKLPDSTAKNKENNSIGSGTTFKRVQVIKGATDVGYSEIKLLEELPKGTKVAIKGAFFLMAKMTNVEE